MGVAKSVRGGAAGVAWVGIVASACYVGAPEVEGGSGIDIDSDDDATRGTDDEDPSGGSGPSGSASTSTSEGGDDPPGDSSGNDSNGTTTGANTTGDSAGDTDEPPPPIDDGCQGYATRYWDCCKAHCAWPGNVPDTVMPLTSCNQSNVSQGGNYDLPSSCDNPQSDSSYTCYSLAPWAVGAQLAYAFAAVPSNGDICGRCYQLQFDGTSHNGGQDPGSQSLAGKTMVVQAINIGYDVGGGQFDLLIPGGGVGSFDACSTQWGVSSSELGATYGGFLAQCKQELGYDAPLQSYKDCVAQRCSAVFAGGQMADLLAGCNWFVDWFEVADNPNLLYQEIQCPQALVAVSGIDRGADVGSCG